jgi:hypothetical protein
MRLFIRSLRAAGVALLFGAAVWGTRAETDLAIYSDSLLNGFEDSHWFSLNLSNTAPVHSGACSISLTPSANGQGIHIRHPGFDTTPYSSLSFWVLGSSNHGQRVLVQGLLGDTNPPGDVYYRLTVPIGNWREVTIPLTSLGIAKKTNCTGFWVQLTPDGMSDALYLDDVRFDVDRTAASAAAAAAVAVPTLSAPEPWPYWNVAVWCIAGALAVISVLLLWLVLMLRRGGWGASRALIPVSGAALAEIGWGADGLPSVMPGASPAALEGMDDAQTRRVRERVALELAEFAKQSLVQGLYSQRSQLIENQHRAQEELATLEARLAMLQLPLQERIRAYESRIVELEKQLETRDREMQDMIQATLSLVRERLEDEKAKEGVGSRLN